LIKEIKSIDKQQKKIKLIISEAARLIILINTFKFALDMFYQRKMAYLKKNFKPVKTGAERPFWLSQPVRSGQTGYNSELSFLSDNLRTPRKKKRRPCAW